MVAFMYGIAETFVVFLLARILWGVSYSFLRQAGIMTVVRAGADADLGERMGYFRGINATLLTLGVFIGCLLHDVFGFSAMMMGLGIVSLASIPIGYYSQKKTPPRKETSPGSISKKSQLGLILFGFILGVVGPGMIISTLGLVLKTHIGDSFGVAGYTVGIATLTGFILGIKCFVDAVGSPLVGMTADQLGRRRSLLILFPLSMVTLITIALVTVPILLIFLIFIFFICSTALMTLLSVQSGEYGSRSVASYATAMDFGMSVGPLVAWSIAQFGLPTSSIFITGGVIYGIGSVIAFYTFGLAGKY
jgi:predicted MFS family arabinose efflux permease